MKKKLFTVCILVLAMQAILGESYMTEEVFTVEEGAEVKVTILYESGSFEVNLTISNTSEKIIVLNDYVFKRSPYVYFVNSLGEPAGYRSNEYINHYRSVRLEMLLFLEPNESVNYTYAFQYYLDDDSQEIVISDDDGERFLNKGDQIYCVIKYAFTFALNALEDIKALTDEYLLEPFEKTYRLELEF